MSSNTGLGWRLTLIKRTSAILVPTEVGFIPNEDSKRTEYGNFMPLPAGMTLDIATAEAFNVIARNAVESLIEILAPGQYDVEFKLVELDLPKANQAQKAAIDHLRKHGELVADQQEAAC